VIGFDDLDVDAVGCVRHEEACSIGKLLIAESDRRGVP
jgi:hypothetical protein